MYNLFLVVVNPLTLPLYTVYSTLRQRQLHHNYMKYKVETDSAILTAPIVFECQIANINQHQRRVKIKKFSTF